MLHKFTHRRTFLSSGASIAAGAAFLSDAVSKESNPAAQVEDRGSNLRITSIEPYRVGSKAYIKILTNFKINGWGEVTGLDPNVAVALAKSLTELLIGENPTRVEHLWQKVYRAHRDIRGGPFLTHVLSAFDMALWDITGRAYGVPVYRLLGGPTRDKVRVYPTPFAFKAGTGGPWPYSADPHDIDHLVSMVKSARKRLGPEGALMFDAHSSVPPATLIQFANAVEPYDLLFLEEVAVPGNIEVFKRLKQHIRIPMATGERDRTIWGMLPYLQERCIDILQPDCGHTGGISQVKKIATLAETFFVPLAPHCTMSQLGASASLHASFSVPFLLIHELYLDGHIMPPGVANISWKVDEEGYVPPPDGPGLGVDIDESMFAKVNAMPNKQYRWPTATMKDGAIRDY
jgi:galactonate dehydratase